MSVRLPVRNRYTPKDQTKADFCNKFIGRGSLVSSTGAYARAYGEMANCGEYTADDHVMVSVEGHRPGRMRFNPFEVGKAVKAGATIVADTFYHRQRPYNIGERELAAFLQKNGYVEQPKGSGFWVPNTDYR